MSSLLFFELWLYLLVNAAIPPGTMLAHGARSIVDLENVVHGRPGRRRRPKRTSTKRAKAPPSYAEQQEQGGSVSLVQYNIEYQASTAFKGKLSKVQLRAIQNVAQYLANEDSDFVIIPEATQTLLNKLCKERNPADSLSSEVPAASVGKWVIPRASASEQCGYVYEKTASYGALAILYKADKYEMARRTCNMHDIDSSREQAVWMNRKKSWGDTCVNLFEGMTVGRGRVNLLANFKSKHNSSDVVIAAVHLGHEQHYVDLNAFERSLTKFSEAIKLSAQTPVFIVGDFNTHLPVKAWGYEVGIHHTWDELLEMGVHEYDIWAETWLLHGRCSINEVLGAWKRKYGYSDVADAAVPKFNIAKGETAAKGDDGTMGFGWNATSIALSDLDVRTGGRPLDHILFSVPKSWGDAVKTEVYVGLPKMPASDHVPLTMRRFEKAI